MMNIAQAKQEIIHTVQAYTAKDKNGSYKIPPASQRPILLMGPPGIGKTAIMKQIALEEKIGLVEYTLTHHTRQSAVGLPVLEKRVFGGREYTVTEYTMSEILASVYQCIEERQVSEGILFLDEINCVSETLAPTLLQFLQHKTFGTHKLPAGWVIVAAGNPARYNKSVRDFDLVTLDRVRSIEIVENYGVWRQYAGKQQIHSAILAYLDLKGENFYRIRETQEGGSLVTARGWEDLSRILLVYEELGVPVTRELAEEYVQDGEIAGDFAGFYRLCKKYEKDCEAKELFSLENRREPEKKGRLLEQAGFDEKIVVMNALEQGLAERVKAYLLEKACMNGIYQEFSRVKKEAASGKELSCILENCIRGKKESDGVLRKQEILLSEEWESRNRVTKWLEEKYQELRLLEQEERERGFSWIKEEFYRETLKLKRAEEEVKEALEYSIAFMKTACAKGQELALFLSRISGNEEIMAFIRQHGCDAYLEEGQILLADQQEEALKKEIQAFQEKKP